MEQNHKVNTFVIRNKLSDLSEARGLTQMEVVLALGISYNHYAKIEEGMKMQVILLMLK